MAIMMTSMKDAVMLKNTIGSAGTAFLPISEFSPDLRLGIASTNWSRRVRGRTVPP
jgi:hypothetical protein